MDEVIRVLVVDDHALVRRGLRSLLAEADDLEVVGEAGSVGMALTSLDSRRPDVVVLDVRLPDGSGIEVCRAGMAHDPPIRSLILTSYDDDQALFEAILAGAGGFLLKAVGERDLLGAIRRVARGESLLDPAITERVLRRIRHEERTEDPLLSQLTDQEHRVLSLVAEGMTNAAIADEMYLAEKTVKNYVSSVLAKLGMHRRTEAAIYFERHGEE